METKTVVTEIFYCPIDIAFKTPILGDATKTLTGYGIIPAVSRFTEDENWGQVGGSRLPHSVKSLISKEAEIGLDVIVAREENKYWKWQVTDFRQWSMGFTKFQGEFIFKAVKENEVLVRWIYTLSSKSMFAYPFHYFFTKVLWKGNMKGAIKRMKTIAEKREDIFIYK